MRKYRPVLFCFLLSVIVSALLFALTAMIIAKIAFLPENFVVLITIVIPCIAVLISGYAASSRIRQNGMFVGFILAAAHSVVLISTSFTMWQTTFSAVGILKIVAILLSGTIGGIMGVNKKDKVRF